MPTFGKVTITPFKSAYVSKPTLKRFVRRAIRKKGGRRYRRGGRFPLHMGVFPQRKRLKLHYADAITLTSTTTPDYHQFKINSLYDPDYTGTGHQPMYFDQFAAIYKQYLVYGCKFDLHFGNLTDANPAIIGYSIRPNTSFSTTCDDLFEHPMCDARLIASDAAGPAIRRISRYVAMKKVWGEEVSGNYNFQADVTNSPTNATYLTVYSQCLDESTSQTVRFYIHLTFYCEMFALKAVTGS